jgi:hypothetical protein
MDTAGIVVIVIGLAVVAVVAYILLRRPVVGASDPVGTPDEPPEPTTPGAGGAGPVTLDPPVRSVTVEDDEIVVDFAVPLPTDADEWLTRALTSAALETIRRREAEFSLELGQRRVTAVVAKAGRETSTRVGEVPITEGKLPEPVGPPVQVDVATGAQPLLAHAEAATEATAVPHGPDQLAPVGRELELSTEVRNGLIAQGIDPDTDDGGRIGHGILVLAGYVVDDVDEWTYIARRGTEEVLVRVVPDDDGHPELTEEDVSSFLVALGSVATRSGLLVTGKLVPFHLYSKEHDDVRIVGRQRLQSFVDGLVG